MFGLMQDWPLTVDRILDHAARWHGDQPIITRSLEGPMGRTTWRDIHGRAMRLSAALVRLGVGAGVPVATLAWNTGRHIETWYGIMGIGAVCHTLNPRLFLEQLVYIVNHAEDRVLFADASFIDLLADLLPQCPTVTSVILLTGEGTFAAYGQREIAGRDLLCYETLIRSDAPAVAWGGFDERSACGLCYTSGTTGDPKGVLYSHRSTFLHALTGLQRDVLNLSGNDVILPAVPMFHACAWGLIFCAPAIGARLVLPGSRLDPASLIQLVVDEGVTFAAGVPTVWQSVLQNLGDAGLGRLRTIVTGGSACPTALIRAYHERGVEMVQLWGMTEMSPIGTISRPGAALADADFEAQLPQRATQGRPPILVDLKLTDDSGLVLPHDGATAGRLSARGPFVASAYYRRDAVIVDADGFMDTGDIAAIDAQGYMRITDRSKDVIKSGGEWISSIDIENVIMGHPKIAMAAVIGIPHPKWQERPLLLVQLKPGEAAEAAELLGWLDGKIAKWWVPDSVEFVAEIQLGATGKVDKKKLRGSAPEPLPG